MTAHQYEVGERVKVTFWTEERYAHILSTQGYNGAGYPKYWMKLEKPHTYAVDELTMSERYLEKIVTLRDKVFHYCIGAGKSSERHIAFNKLVHLGFFNTGDESEQLYILTVYLQSDEAKQQFCDEGIARAKKHFGIKDAPKTFKFEVEVTLPSHYYGTAPQKDVMRGLGNTYFDSNKPSDVKVKLVS